MSNRITKEIAKEVAKKLTEKKQKALDLEKTKLSELAYGIALARIPADIMKCFKKHKNYFSTSSYLQLTGNGFNHEHVDFNEYLPSADRIMTPNDSDAKKLRTLMDSIQDKTKELKSLRNEIEIALCNLRTYNGVEKEFKEAFKLLPKRSISTALTVNLSSIRERL